MKSFHVLSTAAVTALMIAGATMAPADAARRDLDGDRIPDRWERTHGMNPRLAADAKADFDKDGLSNLAEFRLGGHLRDEDTDNDGHDDGDEVRDGSRSTDLDDNDTDGDGVRDGDEDADRDGIDNEDEDDGRETCRFDDDDRDRDDVDDEDENEQGSGVGDADKDDDGISDGDEDVDGDGEANEDEDDVASDRCDGDRDDDGESDEDEDDLYGTVTFFDSLTGTLSVTSVTGSTITSVVTADTEIELEEPDGYEGEVEDEGTTADLAVGAEIAELELDDETSAFGKVKVYYQP